MTPPTTQRLVLLPPEGVPLQLPMAHLASRALALLLDMTLIFGLLLLLLLLQISTGTESLSGSIIMTFGFLLRVFYFSWFEGRRRGATPGKRLLRLRVVSRDGKALTQDRVLTRNFTREIELFLPFSVLLQAWGEWQGRNLGVLLAATLWLLLVASLPCWNPNRLRLGDLIAGTCVVELPRPLLLPDLASLAGKRREGNQSSPLGRFRRGQLNIYGVHELQLLEDVLRKSNKAGRIDATVAAVAARIREKIGYEPNLQGELPDAEFLQEFYTAQRAALERELMFGNRRERKQTQDWQTQDRQTRD